ncbi:MAG TPA: methyltransferase domain-containing protein [Solirubrobacteraceae bacterium]|nr:methyltransferase domain-containing protein [Solirubrobacteraceae bacterium]
MIARVKEAILRAVIKLSWVGQRHGWNWLTYHPGVFAFFHWAALRQAPTVVPALLDTFPDSSFADVGAGTGVYAAALQRAGRPVLACEHSRMGRVAARAQGVRCVSFDLTTPNPAPLSRRADVAFSFEVAEHLPEALGPRLVSFMLDLAPTVVFSAAQPGQGGHGHINEQPLEYWTAAFERAGARLDDGATATLRRRFDGTGFGWLPSNSQVFRRA